MKVGIGGNRLGSGGKGQVELNNFERSTHDLGYLWKSTLSPGTLVPFLCELALPGDTFDIKLNVDMMTLPTFGPLFGKFKIQLDVFQIPIRLYNAQLHMNKLGIGLAMDKIKFPQMAFSGNPPKKDIAIDGQHVNPSCIMSYLGIRGIGKPSISSQTQVQRQFNAIPYLGYWDIYKQYYANKQEERGYVIHTEPIPTDFVLGQVTARGNSGSNIVVVPQDELTTVNLAITKISLMGMPLSSSAGTGLRPDPNRCFVNVGGNPAGGVETQVNTIFQKVTFNSNGIVFSEPFDSYLNTTIKLNKVQYKNDTPSANGTPQVTEFPLENIDTMRENILKTFSDTPYLIGSSSVSPYGLPFNANATAFPNKLYSMMFNQEGLALKTYQSDIFNNWISTEWIDGPGGISEITSIDTSGGSFTIDELNLANKVYNMLNRIAITGGSYNDWLQAVYSHDAYSDTENPFYLGGLSRMLYFQEITSTAGTSSDPLGSLAGKGVVGGEKKGGNIIAKIDKPSFLMGIISLTPIIDYSQGNRWEANLKHMDELHKPSLDQIGYQDLLTDQLAFWDTTIENGSAAVLFNSVGKQPAWVNYMTNVNRVYGNFALPDNNMFMVLNRRYTPDYDANGIPGIKDITTYIDPAKYSYIFADGSLDSMNFWTQISCDITARRKMSSKVMPNL